MLRRVSFGLALLALFPTLALAQVVTTGTGVPTRPALVTVPSSGRNFPSNAGDTAQAVGVVQINPTAPVTLQQATTTTAAALPNRPLTNGAVITAVTGNAAPVCVGAAGVTTATGYCLAAGQSVSFGVQNLSSIYIVGSNATDKVQVAGS